MRIIDVLLHVYYGCDRLYLFLHGIDKHELLIPIDIMSSTKRFLTLWPYSPLQHSIPLLHSAGHARLHEPTFLPHRPKRLLSHTLLVLPPRLDLDPFPQLSHPAYLLFPPCSAPALTLPRALLPATNNSRYRGGHGKRPGTGPLLLPSRP